MKICCRLGMLCEAEPKLLAGSMLLSARLFGLRFARDEVAGRLLDQFSKADVKDLMSGKAQISLGARHFSPLETI